MTWYDIENILFDGTKENIEKLRCPECGGKISFSCSMKYARFVLRCNSCGYLSVSHGFYATPNCCSIFGDEYTL